ncbi:MAG: hypothetical protein QXK63_02930, partial [Thermoproteus sp.]
DGLKPTPPTALLESLKRIGLGRPKPLGVELHHDVPLVGPHPNPPILEVEPPSAMASTFALSNLRQKAPPRSPSSGSLTPETFAHRRGKSPSCRHPYARRRWLGY